MEKVILGEKIEENYNVEEISSLVEKLDFLDIQILRKFYMTGKEFPFDTQPCCFPILYQEMKTVHRIKIGLEGLRKRLDSLVRHGFIMKIHTSNPTTYVPIEEKKQIIRAVIVKFFLINGISKFL